jgi:hypothetical protein
MFKRALVAPGKFSASCFEANHSSPIRVSLLKCSIEKTFRIPLKQLKGLQLNDYKLILYDAFNPNKVSIH